MGNPDDSPKGMKGIFRSLGFKRNRSKSAPVDVKYERPEEPVPLLPPIPVEFSTAPLLDAKLPVPPSAPAELLPPVQVTAPSTEPLISSDFSDFLYLVQEAGNKISPSSPTYSNNNLDREVPGLSSSVTTLSSSDHQPSYRGNSHQQSRHPYYSSQPSKLGPRDTLDEEIKQSTRTKNIPRSQSATTHQSVVHASKDPTLRRRNSIDSEASPIDTKNPSLWDNPTRPSANAKSFHQGFIPRSASQNRVPLAEPKKSNGGLGPKAKSAFDITVGVLSGKVPDSNKFSTSLPLRPISVNSYSLNSNARFCRLAHEIPLGEILGRKALLRKFERGLLMVENRELEGPIRSSTTYGYHIPKLPLTPSDGKSLLFETFAPSHSHPTPATITVWASRSSFSTRKLVWTAYKTGISCDMLRGKRWDENVVFSDRIQGLREMKVVQTATAPSDQAAVGRPGREAKPKARDRSRSNGPNVVQTDTTSEEAHQFLPRFHTSPALPTVRPGPILTNLANGSKVAVDVESDDEDAPLDQLAQRGRGNTADAALRSAQMKAVMLENELGGSGAGKASLKPTTLRPNEVRRISQMRGSLRASRQYSSEDGARPTRPESRNSEARSTTHYHQPEQYSTPSEQQFMMPPGYPAFIPQFSGGAPNQGMYMPVFIPIPAVPQSNEIPTRHPLYGNSKMSTSTPNLAYPHPYQLPNASGSNLRVNMGGTVGRRPSKMGMGEKRGSFLPHSHQGSPNLGRLSANPSPKIPSSNKHSAWGGYFEQTPVPSRRNSHQPPVQVSPADVERKKRTSFLPPGVNGSPEQPHGRSKMYASPNHSMKDMSSLGPQDSRRFVEGRW